MFSAKTGHNGVVEVFTNATDQLLQCRYPEFFTIRMTLSGLDEMVVNLRRHPTDSNRFPPTFLLSRLSRNVDNTETEKQVTTIALRNKKMIKILILHVIFVHK